MSDSNYIIDGDLDLRNQDITSLPNGLSVIEDDAAFMHFKLKWA